MSELLVEVVRGPLVESRHLGDIVVVDTAGRLLWSAGDPQRVTYARSSAKPLQALPLVESGAADAFGMSDEEIALACASHSGEEAHTGRVLAFLQRIGIDPSHLRCGAHPPYHAPSYERLLRSGASPEAIHNNCSGKHAGMLALAKFLGADLDTYLEPDHPVQRLILQAVAEVTGVPQEDIVLGTDGCGVPVFGLPVDRLARAYAHFSAPSAPVLGTRRAAAMRRIARAMVSHPHLVAGTERFCTDLMSAGQGTLLGKAGAEGVYCAGVMGTGIGLCVKVDDGNARAAYPAVVETLAQAGLVSEEVLSKLSGFRRPQLRNHAGTWVGEIRPVFQLSKH
ncbi:MAG: asparaginase [Alicyclobacillus macrosporangiidus]|uniref:asparaginase n=1 Tax=Alicyclobacillus macrosporangiidus TaxID=392015 RepID=UPI0026F12EFE|nr:asparaginase [Alicyclobacillus macrosporangiidus]MCL6598538.1 asparaginase [Alicyclobacillus macrosporangiidus]